jgi:hypothetical protein
MGEDLADNRGNKTTHLKGGAMPMDGFDSMVAEIKAEFVERKVMARLVDNHIQDQILIFIRKDFLDMFRAQDGVAVADELLSPSWGKYLDDNLEGLPAWMADVKRLYSPQRHNPLFSVTSVPRTSPS